MKRLTNSQAFELYNNSVIVNFMEDGECSFDGIIYKVPVYFCDNRRNKR